MIRLYFLKEEYVTHIFMDGYTGAKLKQESMLEGTNLTVSNYPQVPNHTDEGLEFLKWEDGYFG